MSENDVHRRSAQDCYLRKVRRREGHVIGIVAKALVDPAIASTGNKS